MIVSQIVIGGDTPGVEWRVPVLHFKGLNPLAPKIYLQAALHANELPGTAALHFLCEYLRQAKDAGTIQGDITIVPQANPMGSAQSHFGELQGRFDLGSRTNFNRDFPLIAFEDRPRLLDGLETLPAVEQLKHHLLYMALGADLVLDLHCDDESLQYAYLDSAFWPEASDLAAALEMKAVLLSDGASSAFEEAVSFAWKQGAENDLLTGKLSVTVELRGKTDVYADIARQNAQGLLAFLMARRIIDKQHKVETSFFGPAAVLDHVEIVKAPQGGTVLFERNIGEIVAKGNRVAILITEPGMTHGVIDIHAPQSGLILTRVSDRFIRRGGDLMKIVCDAPSQRTRKAGTLED